MSDIPEYDPTKDDMEVMMRIRKITTLQASPLRLPMNEGDGGKKVQDRSIKKFLKTFLCPNFLKKRAITQAKG